MDFPIRSSLFDIEEGKQLQALFDAQGLIPVITQDNASLEVLMLGWMSREALEKPLFPAWRTIGRVPGSSCGKRANAQVRHKLLIAFLSTTIRIVCCCALR